jgi:hypothetical protein
MNRLRTHIARLTVAVLVLTSFGLYMVQPVWANQSKEAFTNWLSKRAKSLNEHGLQKELDDLRKSSGHLENTIKQASQIVSRNNDDFEFTFAESGASDHIYQLLLIEWSQFQTENAMASIPVRHIIKWQVPATLDKAGAQTVGSFAKELAVSRTPISDSLLSITHVVTGNVVPMVGGIAIGAP